MGQSPQLDRSDDSLWLAGQSGEYTDSETGLVLCFARYYSPAIGRFIARDPSGFAGGVNTYGYCSGDPVNEADPSG